MSKRDDFPPAARLLAVFERQEGRQNPYIPKNKRERQRPCNEQMRSELEWQSWNYSTGRRHHLHLQQIGCSQENGTNHSKKNCKISNCGKSGEHNTVFLSHQPFYKNLAQSLCFSHFAYRHWRMSYTRLGVKTAHFVRVTQAFFSCCVRMTVAQDTSSTHMRGPKDMWIVCLRVVINSRSFVSCVVVHFFPHLLLHSLHC